MNPTTVGEASAGAVAANGADPTVVAALIAFIGVAVTAAVAYLAVRAAREANKTTLEVAREANKTTLEAARATINAALAGQLADRYSKALDQLGAASLDVRAGGIYALEAIARTQPEHYHATVLEVLAAFIREHSHDPWPEPQKEGTLPDVPRPQRPPSVRPDVQTALDVIGRRDTCTKYDPLSINLSGARLDHADLHCPHQVNRDARFDHVDFHGAHLNGANLFFGHFNGAYFNGANLGRADLKDANLGRADLKGADLRGADLEGAVIRYANLEDADLEDARGLTKLAGVDGLDNAEFDGVKLANARWPDDVPPPLGWAIGPGHRLIRA